MTASLLLANWGGSLLDRVSMLLGRIAHRRVGGIAGFMAFALVAVIVMSFNIANVFGANANRNDNEAGVAIDAQAWQRHVSESKARIADAEKAKSYEEAAELSERLLDDYASALGFLKLVWQQIEAPLKNPERPSMVTFRAWKTAVELARCHAHLGEFQEAEAWSARAKEISPNRAPDTLAKEISQCRDWVPKRVSLREYFMKDPALEVGLDLIYAYSMLNEYSGMYWAMTQLEPRFSDDPRLKTEEYRQTREFAMAFFSPAKAAALNENTGPAPIPAKDPRIEVAFQQLEDNWQKRSDFAGEKWMRMPTIEKAKYVNLQIAQQTIKGFNWNPTEEEARDFLLKMGYTEKGEPRDKGKARTLIMSARMTREELAPFDERENNLIESLASLGNAMTGSSLSAMEEDLLAKAQDGPWESRAGREGRWAMTVIGRMKTGIGVLSRRIEDGVGREGADSRANRDLQLFVDALAATRSPEAIPALRRALDASDLHVCDSAFQGLEGIPGGLNQEILLELWESEDAYIRKHAASLLGRLGDEKALVALQRDIPSAYGEPRYEAEDAAWQIESRLGRNPGPRPTPLPIAKKAKNVDSELFYEGVEKSLRSPNKGIRASAFKYLPTKAEKDPAVFDLLIEIVEHDPDPAIRKQAAEALSLAYNEMAATAIERGENPSRLHNSFMTLAQIIATGDTDMAMAAVRSVGLFAPFKDDPAYTRIITRVLDNLDTTGLATQAECMSALSRLLYNTPEIVEKQLSPARKDMIIRVTQKGLSSDYGPFLVNAIEVSKALDIKESIPKLIEFVETGKEDYRRSYAAEALGKIGDSRAIAPLEHMATTDPFVDDQGIYVNRETAWKAIQSIRGSSQRSQTPETAHAESAETQAQRVVSTDRVPLSERSIGSLPAPLIQATDTTQALPIKAVLICHAKRVETSKPLIIELWLENVSDKDITYFDPGKRKPYGPNEAQDMWEIRVDGRKVVGATQLDVNNSRYKVTASHGSINATDSSYGKSINATSKEEGKVMPIPPVTRDLFTVLRPKERILYLKLDLQPAWYYGANTKDRNYKDLFATPGEHRIEAKYENLNEGSSFGLKAWTGVVQTNPAMVRG